MTATQALAPKAFVIGHPIAHSRSPLIHGHWLAEHGIAGSYERIDVAPADLAAFLAGFAARGFVGGNVTVPHKEAVFALLAEGGHDLSDEARRLGAVNTLSLRPDGRLLGHNTDGAGFVASVDEAVGPGWETQVDIAAVIGAGGAARAIVGALLDRGIGRILVANRTPAKAEGIRAFDPARIETVSLDALPWRLSEAGLLVNTTSLGMKGQPDLDLDSVALPDSAIVADIVYVPAETSLLAAARARGLRRVGGLGMLLHQAVPGFECWFGTRPAVAPALRAIIEADIGGRVVTFRLGLTGSIGMGKSATAAMFRARGIPVQDADAAVHALYRGRAAPLIEQAFPGTVVNGVVDRVKLGPIVLGDPAALKRLEAIVHPLVRAEEEAFLGLARERRVPLVVLDIPLLFESGGEGRCDAVAVVTAPAETQRDRVLARPGMTEATFRAILAKQMPDAEKRRRAHFLVDSSLGFARAEDQVSAIVRALAGRPSRSDWPSLRRERPSSEP